MKKICKSCDETFNNVNYKYCPYCKTSELVLEYSGDKTINEIKEETYELDKELLNINKQITELKNKEPSDYEDIIENKFLISQLEEKMELTLKKTSILNQRLKHEETIKKSELTKIKVKEKLYMRLFVELDDEVLLKLCNHFSISESSKEENLNKLINKKTETEINNEIEIIEKELKEEKARLEYHEFLHNKLTNHEISLFAKEYSIPYDRNDVINYLVENFTKEEVKIIKIDLCKKEKEKKENEEKKKIKLKKRRQRKKEILELFNESFDEYDDKLVMYNYIPINGDSRGELIAYCVDLTKYEIDELIKKTNDEIKNNLINEVQSFNLEQLINIANYLSLGSNHKEDIINKLNECSIHEIRDILTHANN